MRLPTARLVDRITNTVGTEYSTRRHSSSDVPRSLGPHTRLGDFISHVTDPHHSSSGPENANPAQEPPQPRTAVRSLARSVLQDSLDDLARTGFPAALGTWTSPTGDHYSSAAGIADLSTGQAAEPDQLVRIGSATKMFTAAVVMQLVDEGKVELDSPIHTALPELVRHQQVLSQSITLRQLLQHTSGLPDYVHALLADDAALFKHTPPQDLLALALTSPGASAPGEQWAYSNTNYLLLGMLIEAVTGNSLEKEVTRRIVTPLELRQTFIPSGGERLISQPHLRGYHVDAGHEGLRDWTETDPSSSWGSGQIVSTPAELNIFMQALLAGELTSAAALEQMTTTVAADETFWTGTRYGLGLQFYPLSNGGAAWGHGGDFPGYQTRNAVRDDGTAVTICVTALPPAFIDPTDISALMATYQRVTAALDAALSA